MESWLEFLKTVGTVGFLEKHGHDDTIESRLEFDSRLESFLSWILDFHWGLSTYLYYH